jgi:hypothetical protein
MPVKATWCASTAADRAFTKCESDTAASVPWLCWSFGRGRGVSAAWPRNPNQIAAKLVFLGYINAKNEAQAIDLASGVAFAFRAAGRRWSTGLAKDGRVPRHRCIRFVGPSQGRGVPFSP